MIPDWLLEANVLNSNLKSNAAYFLVVLQVREKEYKVMSRPGNGVACW